MAWWKEASLFCFRIRTYVLELFEFELGAAAFDRDDKK